MHRTHVATLSLALVALALPALASLRPPAARPRHRGAPPRATNPPPGPSGALCRIDLVAAASVGAEGCFTDDHVGGQTGMLLYDFSGTGNAEATFGTQHFSGSVSDGVVTVRLASEFHFGDGCDWGTTQTLRGSLASRAFEYEYVEFPKAGQSGCAHPCHATAAVSAR